MGMFGDERGTILLELLVGLAFAVALARTHATVLRD